MYGNVYLAKLEERGEHLQNGLRPVVCISSNLNNKFSKVIVVIPLTTNLKRKNLPCHIALDSLREPSLALVEQITAINKDSIVKKLGALEEKEINKINRALKSHLNI